MPITLTRSAWFPASCSHLLRFAAWFLAAACVALHAQTPAPAIGPAPDWVMPATWTAPEKPTPNATGQDFLLLDDQARLASEETYHRHAYQIVSDAGRRHGSQVYIDFDPSFQTLAIHHLRLIRNGETFDRLDLAKIQVLQRERDLDRQLYNGERSALTILEDVRLGDIIDVAYTRRGLNPVFDGKFSDSFFVEWGTPIRDLRYRLLVPEGRRVDFRQIPSARTDRTRAKPDFNMRAVGGELEMAWHQANIPIVEGEDNVPDSHPAFSFVDLSEYGSWGEVVEWALPLYTLDPKPQPLLDATVEEIKHKAATPEQRIVAALDFVQQEIRYLGIEMGPGSHRPSEPEEVLRRRFGDCKDKSRLMTALLQRLDIHASPALVHSSRRTGLRARLPSPYAFDHVIVSLNLGGRPYLLDPTLAYQRGDRLALRNVGLYGPFLRIAPGVRDLEEASLAAGDDDRMNIEWNYTVTKLEEPAELTITTTATGRAANNLRAYFANRSLDQIGREYLDYYTRFHRGITQRKPIEHRDQPADNAYIVTERYRVDGLFARTGTVLRAEFQPAAIWDRVRPPNLAQRRLPYAIAYPSELKEVITVHLPENWQVTPDSASVTDPAFSVSFENSQPKPRTVRMTYTWKAGAFFVEVARLGEFAANMEKARKMLGYELSWDTAFRSGAAPNAGAAPAFPPNWPMIIVALGVFAGGGYAIWRLARKTNPSPPEPPVIESVKAADPYSYQARAAAKEAEGLGGWLILVAFGLIVRPFLLLWTMIQSGNAYFNESFWKILTAPGTEHYLPNYSLIAPLELLVNCLLIVYSVLLIVLFFRRSYLFPRAIQIFLGFAICVTLFGLWSNHMLNQTGVAEQAEAYKNLIQAVIGAAIWIPYFQTSRRVHRTFIR